MTESDRRPEGLGNRAAQLWEGVTSSYRLRADELILLEDACREVDIIARLDAALVDAPMVVEGSYKQPAPNPALVEVRQHRGTLASLLKQLRLPDQPAQPPLTASEKARMAAHARWGNDGSK